jgi:hypothetical protein
VEMTARSTWKSWEWRVGRDLGGRRIPVTGIDRGDRDVEAGMFWYQLKLRKSLPAWLFDWLDGIRRAAQPVGKTGVLVLRKPRMDDADALVILRYADWVALHGEARGALTLREGE